MGVSAWTMDTNPAVETMLRPLQRWLHASDVVDISINGPGEVWIERAGRGYERESAPEITRDWAWLLCLALATVSRQDFPHSDADQHKKPVLSCTLPGGHRFHAILGASAPSGVIIDIRRRRLMAVELASYGLGGHDREDLEAVAAAGGKILVSGGVNSGKTTFVNSLARLMPAQRRIAVVQDVDEVQLEHPNQIKLLVNRFNRSGGHVVGYADVIDSILRFNCDALVVGELSVDNAAAAFRVLNTGTVGGFLTTLHADSPLGALEAWRRNWELRQQAGAAAVVAFLARNIDRVVQLRRTGQDRREVVAIARRDARTGELDIPWRQLLVAE